MPVPPNCFCCHLLQGFYSLTSRPARPDRWRTCVLQKYYPLAIFAFLCSATVDASAAVIVYSGQTYAFASSDGGNIFDDKENAGSATALATIGESIARSTSTIAEGTSTTITATFAHYRSAQKIGASDG